MWTKDLRANPGNHRTANHRVLWGRCKAMCSSAKDTVYGGFSSTSNVVAQHYNLDARKINTLKGG